VPAAAKRLPIRWPRHRDARDTSPPAAPRPRSRPTGGRRVSPACSSLALPACAGRTACRVTHHPDPASQLPRPGASSETRRRSGGRDDEGREPGLNRMAARDVFLMDRYLRWPLPGALTAVQPALDTGRFHAATGEAVCERTSRSWSSQGPPGRIGHARQHGEHHILLNPVAPGTPEFRVARQP
jgi:hypothetical protein